MPLVRPSAGVFVSDMIEAELSSKSGPRRRKLLASVVRYNL